jgi:Na+/melibiose symporter-like transporter
MNLLKKLHNRRQPAGMEWILFKKTPMLLVASTLIPVMVSVLARVLPVSAQVNDIDKYLTGVDFFSIALAITLFTALFTLTLGCIIVIIMKGPAYVADAYEMKESEYPKPGKRKV